MKKRCLAMIMAFCVALSLVPATALAAGENEGGTSSAGRKIYVDAVNGNDMQNDVGTTAEKAYKNIGVAVKAAESGDTIMLAAGCYSLYEVCGKNGTDGNKEYTRNKDLTFIGAGPEKTKWGIGAKVPNSANFGTEYNSDYSFDVRGTEAKETVTFKNMTLQSGTVDYLGFAGTDNTVVEDCVIEGKTFYWGYTSAEFKNTTFNCPTRDYAIWTYSSPIMTFDTCTFNSSGKVINVYTDAGAGKNDITVNFSSCTVNNSSVSLKPVLNINDSNMGNYKYTINISGNNVVNGVDADGITCSRLFGYGGKSGNNTGRTIVKFGNTIVWQGGKMVDAKACHNNGVTVEGVSYNNGVAGANDSLYAEGYKDNAFTIVEGDWTKKPDGTKTRTITKTCKYCGYQEKTTENAPADPIDWDVPRSKTATKLDKNTWTSDVTLSLPSAEENLASDVVFVLDTSDCVGAVMNQVSGLVTQLKAAQQNSGANIKVGVVVFKGSALPMFDGKLVNVNEAEQKLTEMIQKVNQATGESEKEQVVQQYIKADKNFIYKGSNLHSGLLGAQKLLANDIAVSNTRKYVVTVTDGMTYYWNKGDDVYGVYGGSNADKTAKADLLFYTWCNIHGINDGTYVLPGTFSWDTYVTEAKALIAADKGTYDVNIRDAAVKLDKNFGAVRFITDITDLKNKDIPYINYNDRADHAHGIDQSVIACLATYQEMVDSKYKCYAVNSDYDTSTFPGLFTSELNKLANVTDVDFTSIQNDIFYAVGAGSVVEDKMGADFNFVPGSLKLTVGGTELQSKADDNNGNMTYFGNDAENLNEGNCRFKVLYDPDADSFVWTINENVSNFARVQLTYTVKLTTPETDPGTYGTEDLKGEKDVPADKALFTNESAVLNAKNSAGAPLKPLDFPKPSLAYTISGGGGGGGSHKPPVTIPDDVPAGLNGKDHYAYVVGYPDGMVYPQKDITRAEVATIFFRLLEDETREANMTKSSGYNDVKDGAWYTCAVSTLSKMGIIKGYEDGSFKPDASISRAEFAAIAARFDPDGDTTPATFSDVSSHWAKDEISIAANHGWIKGYEDGSFKPDQKITRAETMTLVNRVLKRLPETKDDLHKDMKTWPDNQNESAWFYLAVQEATNSHYQKLKKDGIHETWESMRETRDWAALEK